MIVLKLYGGLGNQMFMYAYARVLQQEYKECIDISIYELLNNEFSVTKRQYALNHLRLNSNVRVQDEKMSTIYEYMLNMKKRSLERFTSDKSLSDDECFTKLASHGLYSSEEMFKFYPLQKSNRKFKFIDGYFMSWKYYEGINDVLKREFRITTPSSAANQKMLDELKCVNSVCVHIRLGDYVKGVFRSSNYVCKEDYYRQAMNIVAEHVENPQFYIFTTGPKDVCWIKENYHFDYPVRYVDLDNPDYEELRLMINCKHFIISNSSFSWWAQYLCEYDEKLVVAPSRWYLHNQKNVADIYMSEWRLVEV